MSKAFYDAVAGHSSTAASAPSQQMADEPMGSTMQPLPRPFAALCMCVIACLCFLIGATSSRAAAIALTPGAQSLETELSPVLSSYMTKSSLSDPTYYSNGAWIASDGTTCWYCYDTAADGAATLGILQNNASLEQTAITTFSTAIAQHQLSNGAFANDNGGADEIATGFAAVPLGIAYLELHSVLPAATAQTWAASLGNAANYLISSGAMTWYINGNVNLRQTEVMWLAYIATGNSTYYNWYQTELSFTLNPPQIRWPGYGLQITRQPTKADGSDGAGYLAEANTGAPGYDPNYTMAQLNTAMDLYVLTRNQEFLYLMNLEYNQLVSRINTSNWVLNATGGSRDNFMEPFLSGALSVLAQSGDRPDLSSEASPSDAALVSDYQSSLTQPSNVCYYKSVESALSMPLIDQEWPQGLDAAVTQAPATVLTASPTTTVATTVTSVAASASSTVTSSSSAHTNSATSSVSAQPGSSSSTTSHSVASSFPAASTTSSTTTKKTRSGKQTRSERTETSRASKNRHGAIRTAHHTRRRKTPRHTR